MKLIFDYPGTKGAIIGFGTQATDELTFVTKLAWNSRLSQQKIIIVFHLSNEEEAIEFRHEVCDGIPGMKFVK